MQPTPENTMPQNASRRGVARLADRIGATASFLCAIHCAVLPFVLAALPAFGLGFLADHGFERGFIIGASLLALGTVIHGYRRHRVRRALALLLPGLMLLWIGGFVMDAHSTLMWHALFVALGGSCVAAAHLTNLRLVHVHDHSACCEHDDAHDHHDHEMAPHVENPVVG
jgi:membrane-bound ClpP family serine protease